MTKDGHAVRGMLVAAVMVLLVTALGCAKGGEPVQPAAPKPPATTPPATQPRLEGTDWECRAYSSADEALVDVIAGTSVTARFENGVLSGSTGVNTYEGGYTLDGDSLEIDPAFQVTERGGSPEAMDQESAFLAVIGRAKAYSIADGVLELSDANGVRLATFEVAE